MFDLSSSVKRPIVTIAATVCASFSMAANADLASYEQSFETLDQMSATALGDDGWLVFGNVFAPDGVTYLYGYGVFAAPNMSGGFSNVADGQGGPTQGAQQLVIFNDYNNGDHNIGNVIESNVFQEQTIGAADVGQTYTFSYDAKRGDIVSPTTANAFIKTLDPGAGFALTNFITNDTTALPVDWARYELSITIDAGLVGQILQIGFSSTAANFTPSGNFYDNIVFNNGDTDGDGVADTADNCTLVANASQLDTNGDNYGNACDPDLDNNGTVNFLDAAAFGALFGPGTGDGDFNGDGNTNFLDYAIFPSYFGGSPGPSGLVP